MTPSWFTFRCCLDCGKVLFQDIYTEETTFVEDAAGGAGNFVRFGGACFQSQRRTLRKGNVATNKLLYKNGITKVSHATRHNKGRETMWCPHCAREGGTGHDHTTGSVYCVDCGKVLFKEMYTEKSTFFTDATGGPNPMDYTYAIGKEPVNHEDDETEEDDYSETVGHECRSYDNEQESCSYDYDYDYDAEDENDDY
ncbi:hypothetical protein OSB04_008286 [Centaurea solstitialis]|uniref:Uncharacterized protein n=1 Tax=Centaurea solstitialis TaxID=347529 RepID=A0AA38TX05_9ASTR|nr:hypothetical protein OSB04_008286 [Centaurea solstitialis]